MTIRFRHAEPRDLDAFLQIRDALQPGSGNGGFLLGSDPETYATYIREALVWVCERGDAVVGFAIALPDSLFRQTEIWDKRQLLQADPEQASAIQALLSTEQHFAYLEQLAFRRSDARYAPALCLHLGRELFSGPCSILLATTVREPFLNRAAWPFLEIAGGRIVGQVEEVYPRIGKLVSDVWMLRAEDYRQRIPFHPMYQRLFPDD